ncbi:dihydroxyacetone kinase subunit DhaK [Prosthecomicrobium pneumaticum]|uniref:Dihydroxyacetone kinase-like protein n=1 Tax=Prosthecomicrobium pneumaticum TaxID=81895 RepID=A0A7W9CU54_9HYPH|nr:dihydroxyacetone kinase subunit DhaK [Prosthecomicrobium pneumaticum]MBB5751427.1 dihydroxyacetone kinase-like protein [Prosthecomicrobium pneumaticum]
MAKAAKKILNDPRRAVSQMIDGLVLASDGRTRRLDGLDAIVKTEIPDDKVALLIGGGSGHEPIFHGLVGDNLGDGAACGQFFAAPAPHIIYETAKAVHRGKGILFLYGNYAGDNMNFDIAAEMLTDEGIDVRTVRVRDDVAAAPPERMEDRRGIAGDVLMIKIAGAAAATLDSLDEVERVARKAAANVRSMGVAVSAGSIPETGKPTFELADDEIEVGMGAHGEAGIARQKLAPADEVADQLMSRILPDLPFSAGDEVALLLNNLGATTMMEMLVVNRRIRATLAERGIAVHRTDVGTWLTVQEMAGFSVTLMRLDDELKRYLDMPCRSVGFSHWGTR